MKTKIMRIFVEKKPPYAVEAGSLANDLKENLKLTALQGVRILNRYDVAGLSEEDVRQAREIVFSEPAVDCVYDEAIRLGPDETAFAVSFLPGQYDQRADSAAQCIQLLTQREMPVVQCAKVIILEGKITDKELAAIKSYYINPVESREAPLEKPSSLEAAWDMPPDVEVLEGFIRDDQAALTNFLQSAGLAMSLEDLSLCQAYFKETEQRDPTITEIRVIDTYWSDHCRHKTFNTRISSVELEEGGYAAAMRTAYSDYQQSRRFVYGDAEPDRDISLMDLAVLGAKECRKKGLLDDLEVSDEVNACSIGRDVDVDGEMRPYLILFKNETHNHPTEIEPFGGAATCLGGAIRDPLSGRGYVFGAMRVTGSADPRRPLEETLAGKLPQRQITLKAAAGYSAYGNQIGLAAGQVAEVYDEGFLAKRMELGAVIAAAPRENVIRKTPEPGDAVILVGGRTGRDGCGGATGSSVEQDETSLLHRGAEVQKGNAPTERKIQRLFRDPKVSRLIKRCNDFGAGGVSVAIGELSDGVTIDLDRIRKKYEGLDGTELAISESQERMAVVVKKEDAASFIQYALKENLEAVQAAEVTAERRLRMLWRGRPIVDIDRDFLDSSGAKRTARVRVTQPNGRSYFQIEAVRDVRRKWMQTMQDLNVCSQKGLIERFDSTIGAGTVLMPFGGRYAATAAEAMCFKIPVPEGDTTTGVVMAYGYDPAIGLWSPFHGALYAVVESVAKAAAAGSDHRSIRLSFQEYFEKLGQDPAKWGRPFAALLGAFRAQKELGIPAIGGKDSMSGTFQNLCVPPTLVSFAINTVDTGKVVSPEFKQAGSRVVLLKAVRDDQDLPRFEQLKTNYDVLYALIQAGKVLSAHTVKRAGVAEAVTNMCFGSQIGFEFADDVDQNSLFTPDYGSIVLEMAPAADPKMELTGADYDLLGVTKLRPAIRYKDTELKLDELRSAWEAPLEKIFPVKGEAGRGSMASIAYEGGPIIRTGPSVAQPRVFIPVFPGTNCEYDTQKAFQKAGAKTILSVFRNLSVQDVEASVADMVCQIRRAQIIALPGGFSAGDEPDGSGKFIAAVFRNPNVKEAVRELLEQRDGLILGICNGFQALIKLGLLPYGEIRDLDETAPTLTYNTIGRHVSRFVQTKVVSDLSPWFSAVRPGDIHSIAVSHGEGRFVCSEELAGDLARSGQIAAQYVDLDGRPSLSLEFNPNGSAYAVEALTSADGRILGKMGHSERIGKDLYKNVPGDKDQKIFLSGVNYFK